MEVAGALLERGCHVTIIEKEPGIVSLYYNEEAEVYIRQTFMDRGAEFLTGKMASEVKKKNGRVEIALSDGKLLRADILVNASGVRSRTSFLVGSGIKVNSGIVTDNRSRKFKKLVFDGGRLVGAMYFNENIEPGVIVYLIKKRVDISAHKEALFGRTRPLTDPWLSTLKFSPARR